MLPPDQIYGMGPGSRGWGPCMAGVCAGVIQVSRAANVPQPRVASVCGMAQGGYSLAAALMVLRTVWAAASTRMAPHSLSVLPGHSWQTAHNDIGRVACLGLQSRAPAAAVQRALQPFCHWRHGVMACRVPAALCAPKGRAVRMW